MNKSLLDMPNKTLGSIIFTLFCIMWMVFWYLSSGVANAQSVAAYDCGIPHEFSYAPDGQSVEMELLLVPCDTQVSDDLVSLFQPATLPMGTGEQCLTATHHQASANGRMATMYWDVGECEGSLIQTPSIDGYESVLPDSLFTTSQRRSAQAEVGNSDGVFEGEARVIHRADVGRALREQAGTGGGYSLGTFSQLQARKYLAAAGGCETCHGGPVNQSSEMVFGV